MSYQFDLDDLYYSGVVMSQHFR